MNTDELRLAYDALLGDVATASFRPPSAGEWGADLILAHLIVNDGLLIDAVSEVLAGHSPSYDNAPAIDIDRLTRRATDAGGVGALIDQLRDTSRQVVELASRLDDGEVATMIPTRIVDGETVQVDQPLPLGAIFRAQTAIHLHAHRDQLAALTASPSS